MAGAVIRIAGAVGREFLPLIALFEGLWLLLVLRHQHWQNPSCIGLLGLLSVILADPMKREADSTRHFAGRPASLPRQLAATWLAGLLLILFGPALGAVLTLLGVDQLGKHPFHGPEVTWHNILVSLYTTVPVYAAAFFLSDVFELTAWNRLGAVCGLMVGWVLAECFGTMVVAFGLSGPAVLAVGAIVFASLLSLLAGNRRILREIGIIVLVPGPPLAYLHLMYFRFAPRYYGWTDWAATTWNFGLPLALVLLSWLILRLPSAVKKVPGNSLNPLTLALVIVCAPPIVSRAFYGGLIFPLTPPVTAIHVWRAASPDLKTRLQEVRRLQDHKPFPLKGVDSEPTGLNVFAGGTLIGRTPVIMSERQWEKRLGSLKDRGDYRVEVVGRRLRSFSRGGGRVNRLSAAYRDVSYELAAELERAETEAERLAVLKRRLQEGGEAERYAIRELFWKSKNDITLAGTAEWLQSEGARELTRAGAARIFGLTDEVPDEQFRRSLIRLLNEDHIRPWDSEASQDDWLFPAREALKAADPERVRSALCRFITRSLYVDGTFGLGLNAVYLLGELRDPRSTPAIIRHYRKWRDRWSVEALGKMGTEEATEVLVKSLDFPGDARNHALRVLLEIRHPRAIPEIELTLERFPPDLRGPVHLSGEGPGRHRRDLPVVLFRLPGMLPPERCLAILGRYVSPNYAWVQALHGDAMGASHISPTKNCIMGPALRIRRPEARALLVRLTKSGNEAVRKAAERAVELWDQEEQN